MFKKLRHIDNQIANHGQAGQRAQYDGLLQAADVGQAGQAVFAVDVHAVRTANAFAAGAAEGKRVVLRFEFHDGVEQFHIGRLDFQFVILHVRLGIFVGIVAVHL